MVSHEFEQALQDVEKSKEEIAKVISNLKSGVSNLFADLGERKKTILESEKANLIDNPTVVLTEFFALGFYAGKLLKKLLNTEEN